mgnify:CR=1 FL=1
MAEAAKREKKKVQADYDQRLAVLDETLTTAKEAVWLYEKFGEGEYRDILGLCRAASLAEIGLRHGFFRLVPQGIDFCGEFLRPLGEGRIAQYRPVFLQQSRIFFRLSPVQHVMANPPFNVDKVNSESAQSAGRLPFGLPSVNKAKEVGNANYLWISYFYSYLNEKGRVGLIPGFDNAVESVDRHVHQTELGVVLHLLLSVEGHGGVGLHAGGVDEIAGLNEHAAVLPKDYTIFSDELLAELLRIFNNSALDEVGGDVIGRIYEYFLNKFAKNIAQDDGVFFTPKSLVKMIVNILEPQGGPPQAEPGRRGQDGFSEFPSPPA